MEDMITVKEMASRLKVHQATLYRYVKRGVLHGVRIGGRLRFSMAEAARVQREGLRAA